MLKIKLQIITPEKVVFSEEVDQLSVTTQTGEITMMKNWQKAWFNVQN
jgi:F0F1-type ATP synthase epsilon subunit